MLRRKELATAATTNDAAMIHALLTDNDNLCYADEHNEQYDKFLLAFINQTIETLKHEKLEAEKAQRIFRVDKQSVFRAFYIMKNLIRRNDTALLTQLRFLLSLFDVNLCAHQAMTESQPNELLRLALRSHNVEAVKLLMTLPEINRLSQSTERCDIQEWGWVSKQPWLETESAPEPVPTTRSWASMLANPSETTSVRTAPVVAPTSDSEMPALGKAPIAYTPWATWSMQSKSKQPSTLSWADRLKHKPSC
jgi:hypothetical protein